MRKGINQNNALNQIALTRSNDNQITINNSPIEYLSWLVQNGRFEEAASVFKQVYTEAEKWHPLYPNYIYKPVELGSKIVFEHRPANKKVAEQLPLQYKGKFSIEDKDFLQGENLNDFLRRKYFSQEKIKIDMKYIETWIGEHLIDDSISLESHIVDDGEWFILPGKLPPPIKTKLVFSDNESDTTAIDYLELRVVEFNNKENTIQISNINQKSSPIVISLIIPRIPSDKQMIESTSKINIKIREEFEGTVIAEKTLLEFMKYSSQSSRMCLVEIEKQREFFIAESFDLDDPHDSNYTNGRIEILSELMKIENAFNVQFQLPDKMSQDDFNVIEILNSIIQEKEITTTFGNFNAIFESKGKDGLKKMVDDMEEQPLMIGFREDIEIELFGVNFKDIEASHKLENAVINNPERIRKKLEYLDDGETVKIDFKPGTKNTYRIKYEMIGEPSISVL